MNILQTVTCLSAHPFTDDSQMAFNMLIHCS